MLDVILNESEVVNDFLKTYKIPKHIKPTHIIYLLAKKYYLDGKQKEDIYMKILKDIKESYGDKYIYTKWNKIVKNTVNRFFREKSRYNLKIKMNDIKEIAVSENELNKISELNNSVLEKIAFVMLVYAKISKIQLQQDNKEYWVNKSCSTICKEAKVGLKGNKQKLIMNELYNKKYISMSDNNNKTNIKINYINEKEVKGENDLVITDFDGVVHQYLIWKGEKWKRCEECGKWIRQKNNKIKYCDKCAEKIKKEQNKIADKKYKEKAKSEKIE